MAPCSREGCSQPRQSYPRQVGQGDDAKTIVVELPECAPHWRERSAGRRRAEDRWVRGDGYVAVRVDGAIELEHRLVMERILGRPLRPGEEVRHRNGEKADNRPENLRLRMELDVAELSEVACPHCGKTSRAVVVGIS